MEKQTFIVKENFAVSHISEYHQQKLKAMIAASGQEFLTAKEVLFWMIDAVNTKESQDASADFQKLSEENAKLKNDLQTANNLMNQFSEIDIATLQADKASLQEQLETTKEDFENYRKEVEKDDEEFNAATLSLNKKHPGVIFFIDLAKYNISTNAKYIGGKTAQTEEDVLEACMHLVKQHASRNYLPINWR